ncbi:hypothetical protein GCM10023191_054000 [Actinoallomurus oryzae]|uniref:Uncharacterized protein n=1 Tax=Actinoallomurus oryzae TaxID=502180 RepID=A0ABP8QF90_9ACTN
MRVTVVGRRDERLLADWVIESRGQGSNGERRYAWAWIGTASPHHHRRLVLTMGALAVVAVTAAHTRMTSSLAPTPATRDTAPPVDPGLIPLTVAPMTSSRSRTAVLV